MRKRTLEGPVCYEFLILFAERPETETNFLFAKYRASNSPYLEASLKANSGNRP